MKTRNIFASAMVALGLAACDSHSSGAQMASQSDQDKYKQAADKVHARLESLAAEAEKDVVAQKDSLLDAAQQEYTRDKDGFRFNSIRRGDFLNISVARMSNQPSKYQWTDYGQTYSTSVNLKKIDAIRLVEGHPPDQNGEVSYGYSIKYKDSSGIGMGGTGFGNYEPTNGGYYDVSPRIPSVPSSRRLSYVTPEPQPQQGGMMYSDDSYSIQFVTKNFTRIAEDDQIIFDGVRLTLYVPAGLGADVYKKLLLSTGDDKAASQQVSH